MNNQNGNDAEKAIIQLGKIFKIFAVVVVVLIIALCIYLASHSNTSENKVYSQEHSASSEFLLPNS